MMMIRELAPMGPKRETLPAKSRVILQHILYTRFRRVQCVRDEPSKLAKVVLEGAMGMLYTGLEE